MLPDNLVIVGALFNVFGGSSYLISTIKGQTRPNRVSFSIWAAAPLIAFFAELNKGVGLQSLMTFMVGFSPLLIFFASFLNKKSEWKLTKLDLTCGVLSVFGLILWFIFREGNIAILFSIIADGLASIPTVIKSYKFPETENFMIFLCGSISAMITILTIKTWNFEHYGFPIYIFAICVILFVLIKFKVGQKKI